MAAVTPCTLSSLYLTHAREVRAHISRKLSSQEDVDDLVQEVFLRSLRAVLLEHVEHPRAYLYQVAGSVVADYFRKSYRRNGIPTDAEPMDEERDGIGGPTPEEIAIGEETWEMLSQGIERLPLKVRQAILLRKIEDLSYREVAEAMGISVRTVEKHLARALSDLRKVVASGGGAR